MPTDQNKVFINPKDFKEEDLPVIVLSDDLRGFIGWAIKEHTSGNWNHIFIMHKPGLCVSQDFTGFKEKSINKYMIPGQMLKFWRIKDLTVLDKMGINNAINKRLALPWWRKSYDFLGVFIGQAFHLKWIQSPWQTFCSEQVSIDYILPIARANIMKVDEPSPSDLDKIFKQCPELMETLGYYLGD